MIDNDMLEFYSELIEDETERFIIHKLLEDADNESILKFLLDRSTKQQ